MSYKRQQDNDQHALDSSKQLILVVERLENLTQEYVFFFFLCEVGDDV